MYLYKKFCRNIKKIEAGMQEIYNNGFELNVVRYILKQIKEGRYRLAYETILVESDKLSSTKYGILLRKHKIYENMKKMYARSKYKQRIYFKTNFKSAKDYRKHRKVYPYPWD